ncbi:Hypothetical protein PMT_2756 [Prochlorococcus marinus str. MIT 9313]|uniref:Uncharacterized protein n=1 Tax=Prochlorococcus marinus (strain MIT 9313) TaxID=74547 RepID=B9ESD3_PROMM|nr:Hypothetical protein PMT_2756 [Prochlorococcus marinus str. MIT 9313]
MDRLDLHLRLKHLAAAQLRKSVTGFTPTDLNDQELIDIE